MHEIKHEIDQKYAEQQSHGGQAGYMEVLGIVNNVKPNNHIIKLSDEEKSQFLEVVKHFHLSYQINPYTDTEEFLREATLIGQEISKRVRKEILDFRLNGNDEGVLLIKELPQDEFLPDTPSEKVNPCLIQKRTFTSELRLTSVAGLLGDGIAYSREDEGTIIPNIYPTRKNEEKQTNDGSKVNLELHKELAFLKGVDYVLLTCLKSDHEKKAKTTFVSIRKVLNQLTPRQKEILFKPRFRCGVDASWGFEKGKGPQIQLPVLYGDPLDPFLIYDRDLMYAETEEGKEALEFLGELLMENLEGIVLEPGDLLIIDNCRAVHGRTPFVPRYDGNDRWLQRLLVVRDMRSLLMDKIRNERILHYIMGGGIDL